MIAGQLLLSPQVSLDRFFPFSQILSQHCSWSEIGVSNGKFLKKYYLYLIIFILLFANSTAVNAHLLPFPILGMLSCLNLNLILPSSIRTILKKYSCKKEKPQNKLDRSWGSQYCKRWKTVRVWTLLILQTATMVLCSQMHVSCFVDVLWLHDGHRHQHQINYWEAAVMCSLFCLFPGNMKPMSWKPVISPAASLTNVTGLPVLRTCQRPGQRAMPTPLSGAFWEL